MSSSIWIVYRDSPIILREVSYIDTEISVEPSEWYLVKQAREINLNVLLSHLNIDREKLDISEDNDYSFDLKFAY
ncbi:MAG: hypothetical protein ACTSQF_15430, partial [Candidatus Heimdallarchaeaceae archaeon]